jgi:hypothetical protein
VRASIYHDALERHLAKWWNGENRDRQDARAAPGKRHCVRRHHARRRALRKLEDDRPPSAPMSDLIEKEAAKVAAHLRELFKHHNPKQFTIADSPRRARKR